MILASQLKSDELTRWVEKELDGYESIGELPDYRIIDTLGCVGKWTNGHQLVSILNRGTNCGFKLELFGSLVRLANGDPTSTYARGVERNSLSAL